MQGRPAEQRHPVLESLRMKPPAQEDLLRDLARKRLDDLKDVRGI